MGWFDKEMVDTHNIDELEMYNWTWIWQYTMDRQQQAQAQAKDGWNDSDAMKI